MRSSVVFAFLFTVFCCFNAVSSQAGPCSAVIHNKLYDLTPLYQQVSEDFSAMDTSGNAYYWAPCRKVFNPSCTFSYDNTPGVCQKDNRAPPQFHGLGTFSGVTFDARTDNRDGFILTYNKGGEPTPPPPRTANLSVICDRSQTGLGVFTVQNPAEDPVHAYHLQFISSYACPASETNCTKPLGEWLGFWEGGTLVLQFSLYDNGTGELNVISNDCVWRLAGFYEYRASTTGLRFNFLPSNCRDVNNNPNQCSQCPVIEVIDESVEWSDTCRSLNVDVTSGATRKAVKFQFVPRKQIASYLEQILRFHKF